MPIDRVTTYGTMLSNDQRLTEAQKNNHDLTLQVQRGGKKSDYYRDFADASQEAIELQTTVSRYEKYQINAVLVKSRLTQTEAILRQIEDVGRDFLGDIVRAMSPGETQKQVLVQKVAPVMQNVQRLANNKLGGVYLLSGAAVDVPPVDITSLSSQGSLSLATDYSYYQGSGKQLTIQLDDSSVMSYGIVGNIPGIERLLHSLVIVKNGASQLDAVLQDALTSANAALADLTLKTANVGLQINTIERLEEQQQNLISYSSEAIQNLGSEDLASVILKQRMAEQHLEAIYATLRNSMKTSLVNYMR